MSDTQTTTAQQQRFLEAFSVHGITGMAATEAGVSRATVHDWLERDQDFRERFEGAEEDTRSVIRQEVHRRAIEGWDEPVYQRGKLVGYVRKRSRLLLRATMAAQQHDRTSAR